MVAIVGARVGERKGWGCVTGINIEWPEMMIMIMLMMIMMTIMTIIMLMMMIMTMIMMMTMVMTITFQWGKVS